MKFDEGRNDFMTFVGTGYHKRGEISKESLAPG
jgi:hypothetical protein